MSDGPVIKAGDREALQDVADDLKNCEITLKATGRLAQINNEDRLIKILEKFPTFLKSRWKTEVQEILILKTAVKEKNDPILVVL